MKRKPDRKLRKNVRRLKKRSSKKNLERPLKKLLLLCKQPPRLTIIANKLQTLTHQLILFLKNMPTKFETKD